MTLKTSSGIRLALVLLVLVIMGGTLGYVAIEGWSVWDAVFMTVTTVTTVGYREIHPLSGPGQVFTVVLIIGGVSTALYTLSLVGASLVEGHVGQRFERRRRERMIEALTDHFILCGAGRIGTIIAEEFRRQQVPFVVIDRDPDAVRAVLSRGDLGVEADASREEILKQAGIDRARGLIAALGSDAENVYTILTARGLRSNLYIIARADSDDAGRKLIKAGADRFVSPYQIGATQIAQTALRPAVMDFVRFATSSEHLDLALEQVRIAEGSVLAGRSILEANLRQRFGVIVVGIQRRAGSMDFNPASDAVMHPDDQLVVLGRPAQLRGLEAAAEPAGGER